MSLVGLSFYQTSQFILMIFQYIQWFNTFVDLHWMLSDELVIHIMNIAVLQNNSQISFWGSQTKTDLLGLLRKPDEGRQIYGSQTKADKYMEARRSHTNICLPAYWDFWRSQTKADKYLLTCSPAGTSAMHLRTTTAVCSNVGRSFSGASAIIWTYPKGNPLSSRIIIASHVTQDQWKRLSCYDASDFVSHDAHEEMCHITVFREIFERFINRWHLQ